MTTTSEASSTILAAMSGAALAETAPCEEEKWAAKFEEEFEEWERETFGVNFPKGDGEATIHCWGLDASWKPLLVLSKCKWRSDATIHLHESGNKLEKMLVWDKLPKWIEYTQAPQHDQQQHVEKQHDADKQHVENLHDSAASSTTMGTTTHDEKQHDNGQ